MYAHTHTHINMKGKKKTSKIKCEACSTRFFNLLDLSIAIDIKFKSYLFHGISQMKV